MLIRYQLIRVVGAQSAMVVRAGRTCRPPRREPRHASAGHGVQGERARAALQVSAGGVRDILCELDRLRQRVARGGASSGRRARGLRSGPLHHADHRGVLRRQTGGDGSAFARTL